MARVGCTNSRMSCWRTAHGSTESPSVRRLPPLPMAGEAVSMLASELAMARVPARLSLSTPFCISLRTFVTKAAVTGASRTSSVASAVADAPAVSSTSTWKVQLPKLGRKILDDVKERAAIGRKLPGSGASPNTARKT